MIMDIRSFFAEPPLLEPIRLEPKPEPKPKHKVSEKFLKGLEEKHNLTLEELQEYKYYGGDSGSHKNYFYNTLKESKENIPKIESHCVCNHSIQEQCYIKHKSDFDRKILVLGNCCIKKFMKHSGRSCGLCDKPHRNRKVNRCNECRLTVCDTCNNKLSKNNKKYTVCYDCYKTSGSYNSSFRY